MKHVIYTMIKIIRNFWVTCVAYKGFGHKLGELAFLESLEETKSQTYLELEGRRLMQVREYVTRTTT